MKEAQRKKERKREREREGDKAALCGRRIRQDKVVRALGSIGVRFAKQGVTTGEAK